MSEPADPESPVMPDLQPDQSSGPMSLEQAVDFFYHGDDGIPGAASSLETFLRACDRNRDGRADRHDSGLPGAPPQVNWIDADIEKAVAGLHAQLARWVRAHDTDHSKTISEDEFETMMDGMWLVQQQFDGFPGGLYLLTEAKLTDNPDRIVTTEKLVHRFGAIIDHGLPDAVQRAKDEVHPPDRSRTA